MSVSIEVPLGNSGIEYPDGGDDETELKQGKQQVKRIDAKPIVTVHHMNGVEEGQEDEDRGNDSESKHWCFLGLIIGT
jgi:hypothetical protein